jgi:nucleotide-binding universal stress UspA family protein
MTIQKARSIRKILVPTDFSDNAGNAARFALELARSMSSTVILYHACRVPVLTSNEMMIAASNTDLEHESREQLRALANRLQAETGYSNMDIRTSSGFAVDEIKELVESESIDLVVMGTKGASGLSGILIGSNTADVIGHCQCPVLAIPEEAHFVPPSRIVFATNYADNDFQTLYMLVDMFRSFNPEIQVVHVEEKHHGRLDQRMFDWFEAQVLASIPYDKFSFHLIHADNMEEALNDFLHVSKADILAVATRHRGFFERLTSKSLTRKLAFHSHLPLLAFHARNVSSTPLF